MAVFLINNCTFNGCGLIFSTLAELIQHIEESHIETDPRTLEKQELQQPPSLALSYIFRFFTETNKKDNDLQKKKQRAQSPASSLRSATPTGSEVDEEEMGGTDDEDSDDSWTTQEEFTSELILSMMNNKESDNDKPFACPVPGCKKRYKNVNGIKYHAKHGHRKDARVKKAFKCKCGKSYKTGQGLRNHTLTSHPGQTVNGVNTPTAELNLQPLQQWAKLQVAQTTVGNLTQSQLTSSTPTITQIVAPVSVTSIMGNGVHALPAKALHQLTQQQLQAHINAQQQIKLTQQLNQQQIISQQQSQHLQQQIQLQKQHSLDQSTTNQPSTSQPNQNGNCTQPQQTTLNITTMSSLATALTSDSLTQGTLTPINMETTQLTEVLAQSGPIVSEIEQLVNVAQ